MCDPLLPKTPKKERDPRQESVGRATNKQTNKKTLCYFWKFCDTDEGIVDKTTQPLLPSFLRCQLKRKEKEEEKKKQIGEWCWRKEEQSERKKKKQTSAKNEEICCITLLLSVVAALFLKARKAHRERDALSWKILLYRASPFRAEQKVIPSSFFFVGRRAFCVYVCVKKMNKKTTPV